MQEHGLTNHGCAGVHPPAAATPIRVTVAGVPRSYQQPLPDGRWLTDAHSAQLLAVSPRVRLLHTTRAALERFTPEPDDAAEVLLLESSGDEPYQDEIPADSLARLVTPALRWVQSCSSGIGHILNLGLLADDVLLTNAAGVHADALAESALAAMLSHAKRLPERRDLQQQRAWRELHCRDLRDATLVILGTGHIGNATARLADAFRMRVIGVRRTERGPALPHYDVVMSQRHLHLAFAKADYVLIACPLTAETEGLIDAAALTVIKPGAYLLNVSRGKVVREDALLHALASGRLSGAYLDAHAQEPLPMEHPLWDAPGVTIIPHDSHSSPFIGDNIVDLFSDNLRRYIAGEPLRNLIDRQRGY